MGKALIDNIHQDHGWEDPFRVFWAVGQEEQQPLPSPPAGHSVGHRPPWTLCPSCLPPPLGWPWIPPVPEQPADFTREFLGQDFSPEAPVRAWTSWSFVVGRPVFYGTWGSFSGLHPLAATCDDPKCFQTSHTGGCRGRRGWFLPQNRSSRLRMAYAFFFSLITWR